SARAGAATAPSRDDLLRRRPPTRRPPASPRAGGRGRPTPDSAPRTPPAGGPTTASPPPRRRPTLECRPTSVRSCTPENRTALPARPASAGFEATSRRPPGALARRLLLDWRRGHLPVLRADAFLERLQQWQDRGRRRRHHCCLPGQLGFDQRLQLL